jgi:hypothetical protein
VRGRREHHHRDPGPVTGPFEESGADREVGDEIGDEGGRRVSTTVIDRDPEDLALP